MSRELGRPRAAAKAALPFAFFRKGARAEAQTERPIIALRQVYKIFREGRPVLRDVNLQVERGAFVFLTGPSGSGKSTLLRVLSRSHTADGGEVEVCGHDLTRLPQQRVWALRRNLGLIFQDFKLVPHWTVFENCALPLEILRLPRAIVRLRVGEALDRVGLAEKGGRPASLLSGGEQQRLGIARAIVHEPACILADEPTGNLDPQLSVDILSLLEEINRSGTTVVFATHDHSLIAKSPHPVFSLEEGEVRPLARRRYSTVPQTMAASA